MTQRGLTTAMINGTVEEVKDYLDAELAKYETWEKLQKRPDLINLLEQKSEKSYNKIKAGVGQTTIKNPDHSGLLFTPSEPYNQVRQVDLIFLENIVARWRPH